MLFIEGLSEVGSKAINPSPCKTQLAEQVICNMQYPRLDSYPKYLFLKRGRKSSNNRGSHLGKESWMTKPGKISGGEGYASLVKNLEHQDIGVLKGRPTILKYFLKEKIRKRI